MRKAVSIPSSSLALAVLAIAVIITIGAGVILLRDDADPASPFPYVPKSSGFHTVTAPRDNLGGVLEKIPSTCQTVHIDGPSSGPSIYVTYQCPEATPAATAS
jgi:hypothetical protein